MKVFYNSEQLSEEAVSNITQKIEAAGGIVRNSNYEILMIYRFGKWDFPKGKVEYGESFAVTARREVEEETGVKVDVNIQSLPSTFHVYMLRGEKVLKETHWFLMTASTCQNLIPQQEEDIEQVTWIPESEVSHQLENSYLSLREFWKDYQNL